jgi:hypothetical protein
VREAPVRASYYLDEATDIDGMTIPIRFHYDLMGSLLSPKSQNGYMEGIVTSVEKAGEISLRPEMKGRSYVEDKRLRSKTPASKTWIKSVWYETEDWITDPNDQRIKDAILERDPRLKRPDSSS